MFKKEKIYSNLDRRTLDAELLRNIQTRKNEKSEDSEIKTCLVIQGGGMRGIYSMGVLDALEEYNLNDAFDYILGSSAGAINGAFFLTKQSKEAINLYSKRICNSKFINFSRLNKIVDIGYLTSEVFKTLDVQKLKDSDTNLVINLTEYETGRPFTVTSKDKDIDLRKALKATASMPFLYNKTVNINGKEFVDGGATDELPLLKAIELGCTDILIILTRDISFRRRYRAFTVWFLKNMFMRDYKANLKEIVMHSLERFNNTMKVLEIPNMQSNPRISVIYPSDKRKLVSMTTKNKKRLQLCYEMGKNDLKSWVKNNSMESSNSKEKIKIKMN